MEGYWRRIVDDQIDELFSGLPAISIEGPRGTGKTTTARQRAGHVRGARRRRCAPDHGVRPAADRRRVPRRSSLTSGSGCPNRGTSCGAPSMTTTHRAGFLLTGSASPTTHPTHSGAGRIVTLKMRPLALAERRDSPLFAQPTVSLRDLLAGNRPAVAGSTDRASGRLCVRDHAERSARQCAAWRAGCAMRRSTATSPASWNATCPKRATPPATLPRS